MSLYLQISAIFFRIISTVGTNYCNMCYKLIFGGTANSSDEKNHEKHASKSSIPGFSTTSEEKKPSDKNLNPFQICDLRPIQYGDTSIASTSTDNPAWSPGECLNIGKYEGRFRKKQYAISSQVILSN